MVVKTFRGQLADAGQERIRLSTIKGKVGYRIVKFQLLPFDPAGDNQESVVQLWKEEQTTATSTWDKINFSDSTLLAAAYQENDNSGATPLNSAVVIFDNEIFNQDIYITHLEQGIDAVNYYLELEVIPLDDAGAEYTTLKDMRQT